MMESKINSKEEIEYFLDNSSIEWFHDGIYDIKDEEDVIRVDTTKRNWEICFNSLSDELPKDLKRKAFLKIEQHIDENRVSDYDVAEEQGLYGGNY